MNKINRTLLDLLNATINGSIIDDISLSSEEWKQLYEEAVSHQIHLIIYPKCKNVIESNPDTLALSKRWKNNAIMGSLHMKSRLSDMPNILKSFQDHNIQVMVLKGLYFRGLYPIPDSRTMGDVDLLVCPDHLDKVTELLIERGYRRTDLHDTMHYTFEHDKFISIELHYTLIRDKLQKSAELINQDIWLDTTTFMLHDTNCIIPSELNHIIYCSLHMARHFTNSGFGLRQLCDFALLIKNIEAKFDWNEFSSKASLYGINKFTQTLLILIQKYLSVDIPESIIINVSEDNKYVALLLDEIFMSGAFGNKSLKHASNKSLAKYKYDVKTQSSKNQLRYYFPSIDNLHSYYGYAKKNPVLLPIAWIHRLFHNLIRSDISFSAKNPNKEVIDNYINLLKWLEIK